MKSHKNNLEPLYMGLAHYSDSKAQMDLMSLKIDQLGEKLEKVENDVASIKGVLENEVVNGIKEVTKAFPMCADFVGRQSAKKEKVDKSTGNVKDWTDCELLK